ncbi:MAG: ribosomal protein S18-alanine N-acetyltransferase [Thermoproteota archaeon]|nr:ribosomal protein S18-alanine N-acetyltransferase [Thermoproteota archaeon]
MSILIIQQATIDDLEELYQIERECFALEAFSKEQLTYLIRSPSSISLTAQVGNKIAGFIIGLIQKRGKTETGHIFTLDVAVKHRRRGVGQKLLEEFERILKERNVTSCYLEVRAENAAALKLYRKNRYVEVEQLKNYYDHRINGIRLKKTL